MNEKLFKNCTSIKEVEEIINKFMEDGLLSYSSDKFLEKWNYMSVVNLETDEVKNKILEMIKYIDEIISDKEKRISLILTFVYLVIKEKINVIDVNENSLFLTTDYADKMGITEISRYLPIITNETLLNAVRMKTLDVEVRVEFLDYLVKHFNNLNDMVNFLNSKDYYEILDIIRK